MIMNEQRMLLANIVTVMCEISNLYFSYLFANFLPASFYICGILMIS